MNKFVNFINKINKQEIMVVGDIIADEFIIGRPERLSREAPVLILHCAEKKILPGGGANAANNIKSLNAGVKLVGIVGNDRAGYDLKTELSKRGIDTDGIIIDNTRSTAVKTRILAGGDQVVKQQVVRIDNINRKAVKKDKKQEEKIIAYIKKNLKTVDAVIISDYGNGVLSKNIKKFLLNLSEKNDKFIALDSRYNLLDYAWGINIATPNLEETGAALNKKLRTDYDVIKAGKELIGKLNSEYLLITRGKDGMTLFTESGDYIHFPVVNLSEVYDVTGAGDTVISVFVLAICTGATAVEAMKMANYAAGIVVRKSGVATVKPAEILQEVQKNEFQDTID